MNSEQQYLNLYFQVHQPRRLKKFHFLDVGSDKKYFDDDLNKEIMNRISKHCYLPSNELLLKIIDQHPELRITFSISGTALEQFERYAPQVLHSFRQLAETGSVEFLGETYYHSLAYFISNEEFIEQIGLHRQKINELIGVSPTFFRNTELIYSDVIGSTVAELGFSGIYIDGIERILKGESPNALYRHPEKELVLMPRNYRLSDDIAFRYSDEHWSEWPLTGKKFASWLYSIPSRDRIVNLAMDYETLGEHKKVESGIFDFFQDFLMAILHDNRIRIVNPSEVSKLLPAEKVISSERAISWADDARDLSAWLGNDMQRDAFGSLYKFHDFIVRSENRKLVDTYRHLLTSDHFYYMSTKKGADGTVHQYFSPYRSPYEAFMNFMNIISDFELRVKKKRRRTVFREANEINSLVA
ncbi:MAG TPA: glycoside hydrolase family 57 protein [Cyclobacteriaceae bacterium]|nr:glycoside hydrolase family 57 protein [Cyclobacteriaceae bacterium]